MSTNLYWRPKDRKGKLLGKDSKLKWILEKSNSNTGYFYESDIPYFRGLADADVSGAQDVIDAIEKHGSIEIFEE